jgi:hypothetical protein
MGAAAPAGATPSDAEAKAIDAVIQRVGALSGVVFVRNGVDAAPAEAARHLRDKYAYFRHDIATAEDFNRLAGTRSELTGQPYLVRLPTGAQRLAADLLHEQLREVRARGR